MLAQVWSAAVRGIDGYPVAVELDLANGLPSYTTVGLPDSAVKESRERVVAALRNSGYDFPCRRVTVNLAPAQFRKSGTQFDLPVALSLLAASGQLQPGEWMGRYCFMGELALNGMVKPVSGVLAMAVAAKSRGMGGVILAAENAPEAAATGIASYGVVSLREAAEFLSSQRDVRRAEGPSRGVQFAASEDLADVRGQSKAKRALEIAAAGGHNIVLVGPPGTGKSMLARRLPGLLPDLEEDEALEVAKIQSVAGVLSKGDWPTARPFRAPHHTITQPALVGGGNPCRPGEATLAHRGVLFLDELAEFSRESLESLRVPLEAKRAKISRINDTMDFPSDFMLAASMNPCPCGYLGHPRRNCECIPPQISRYRARVSGPLWDRVDLRVEVSPLGFEEWSSEAAEEERSERVRARVLAARRIQAERFGAPGRTNASMTPAETRRFCRMDAECKSLLNAATQRLALSARGLDRVLRVARTIADLESKGKLDATHVAEAIGLSGRDQGGNA